MRFLAMLVVILLSSKGLANIATEAEQSAQKRCVQTANAEVLARLERQRREKLLALAADAQRKLWGAKQIIQSTDEALRAHKQRVDRREYIERRVVEGVFLVFSVAFIFHQMGWI